MKPSLLQRLRRSASGALIATVTALAVTLPTAARAHPDATAASAGSSLALSALPLASIAVSAATTVSARTSAVISGQSLMIQPVYGGWLLGHGGIALAWVPAPDAAELSFHQRIR